MCSILNVSQYFGGKYCLQVHYRKISQGRNQREGGGKQRKMEAKYSSETPAEFQRKARNYNPEDKTLHNHGFENLKSYKINLIFLIITECIKYSLVL
jgi:hypothetical protein